MKYILIGDLTGTCSDYGIAMYLRSMQKTLDVIHFIVPAILIIMCAINLTQLMLNPDDPQKKKFNALKNKILAAVIVYFVPFTFNVIFGLMPESFDIANCWDEARVIANSMDNNKKTTSTNSGSKSAVYTSIKESKKKSELIAKEREEARKKITKVEPSNEDDSSSNDNSYTIDFDSNDLNDVNDPNAANRQEIVNYAMKFIGKPYVRGGYWNGEIPYTATDCSGFIVGVYKHFGYELGSKRTSLYTLPHKIKPINESTLKKGDILYYDEGGYGNGTGHVALYIGNGKVMSASGRRTGVKINGKYDYRHPLEATRVID